MKLTCLIDSMGSGGAQRQMAMLAMCLKKMGMEVDILTYQPADFFLLPIREAGIDYRCLKTNSPVQRAVALRRALREGNQDVVLAFLEAPSLYAELASVPRRSWGLVVSERSAAPGCDRGWGKLRRKLHRLADYVTANSHTARLLVERVAPALQGRIATIYNAIDLETFHPSDTPRSSSGDCLRLVVVATVTALKNPVNLMISLSLVQAQEPALRVHLDWYGRLPSGTDPQRNQDAYDQSLSIIRRNGLEEQVHFHPAVTSIENVYREADAVVLPSFYEGLSNVVCEAMACGRPVLASNVTDMGNLIKDGQNGFMFDPTSPEDMARTILRFARLDPAEREAQGKRGREMAERMFNPTVVAARYTQILSAAAGRRRIQVEHWIPEVPQTACNFVQAQAG